MGDEFGLQAQQEEIVRKLLEEKNAAAERTEEAVVSKPASPELHEDITLRTAVEVLSPRSTFLEALHPNQIQELKSVDNARWFEQYRALALRLRQCIRNSESLGDQDDVRAFSPVDLKDVLPALNIFGDVLEKNPPSREEANGALDQLVNSSLRLVTRTRTKAEPSHPLDHLKES